jgi:hypothetical protein
MIDSGSEADASGRPQFRKPVPEGVTEVTGVAVGEASALVPLSDGALGLIAGGRLLRSDDGGATWGEPLALELPDAGRLQGLACIRLQAGPLALVYRDRQECFRLVVSEDDGRTWRQRSTVDLLGSPYYDALIETGDGTLVLPSRECYGNDDHPGLEYRKVSTWGTWKGLPLQVSGHYHYPEIDIAAVSRSRDEGRTWQRGGPLMGWFDEHGIANGYGGISACDEPSVAETADGRLLFFARSTVGRIVASSSSDGGERWTAVRPTELAASYSPPRLRRIPATGDLICVWNQVSREEIRRGHRRGRLSAAISRDSGESWEHFKTIEVSAGLADVEQIAPEYPIIPVIGLPDVGVLPDDFATFDYANVCFAGDRVFLIYHRSWVDSGPEARQARTLGERGRGEAGKPREGVIRSYPLDWFYG